MNQEIVFIVIIKVNFLQLSDFRMYGFKKLFILKLSGLDLQKDKSRLFWTFSGKPDSACKAHLQSAFCSACLAEGWPLKPTGDLSSYTTKETMPS